MAGGHRTRGPRAAADANEAVLRVRDVLRLLKLGPVLAGRLPHIPDVEQPAYLKAVRELEHAANPEAHFDISHYAMPGAKAGWER